jgi:hypothetical protein
VADLTRAWDLGVVDSYQSHEIPQVAVRVTQFDQHRVACPDAHGHTPPPDPTGPGPEAVFARPTAVVTGGAGALEVFDRTLHERHRSEPHPARGLVVRKISAHSHHKHLMTHNTRAFPLVRTVELRGLEPLTL